MTIGRRKGSAGRCRLPGGWNHHPPSELDCKPAGHRGDCQYVPGCSIEVFPEGVALVSRTSAGVMGEMVLTVKSTAAERIRIDSGLLRYEDRRYHLEEQEISLFSRFRCAGLPEGELPLPQVF
jgi:hypothetical protein